MTEFSVKPNAIRVTADEEERLRKELGNIQQSIRKISGSLAIKTTAAPSLKRRLGRVAGRVEVHRESMGNMKNALEESMGLYEKTEQNICRYTGGGIRAKAKIEEKGLSFWDWLANQIGKIADGFHSFITTAWAGLVAIWENIIGNGNVTDEQPTAGWAGQVVAGTEGGELGSATSDGAVSGNTALNGAPRYKQPDYTQKNLAPDENGIYGPYVYHRDGSLGRVCESNIEGQQLSCTYYTLRKLNERGLSYACTGGPGNGNRWYANFDHESGLPNYGGNNALVDLANNLTLPQENIVVSFESGPSITLSDGRTIVPGHVLLIDEIYRDGNGIVKVKYSDMFYSEPGMGTKYITSLNGSNPQVEKTLEDFMAEYNKSNGNINGVVVVGAGN